MTKRKKIKKNLQPSNKYVNYDIPNLEYDIPNLEYDIPNLEYDIPNLEYDIPDLEYDIPDLDISSTYFDYPENLTKPDIEKGKVKKRNK